MEKMVIDARGCACPEPVIRVKKALAGGEGALLVMVDNNVAVENITRFVTGRGHTLSVEEISGEFHITVNI